MSIEEYVKVTITRDSTNPKQADFDTLLLLAAGVPFPLGEVRYYASASDADDDGDIDAVAKAMLQRAFSAERQPSRIALGGLGPGLAGKAKYVLTPEAGATDAKVTVLSPDGSEDILIATGADTSELVGDLKDKIDALTGLGATDDGSTVTVEADAPGVIFRFMGLEGIKSLVDETPALGYDDALAALLSNGVDFYRIAIDVNTPANIVKVANWVLANDRVFIAAPEVSDPAEYVPTASTLKDQKNMRVLSIVKRAGRAEYAGVALASLMSTYQPGSATYMYKTLQGVSTDGWSTTEKAAFRDANVVMYVSTAGEGMTTEGYTAGGEYLDVMEGLDWLTARMEEDVFRELKRRPKLPYTDQGAAVLGSLVEGRLLRAESDVVGILEPGSSDVDVPLVRDAERADRQARRFNKIRWTGRLAGAIHYVDPIHGSVEV